MYNYKKFLLGLMIVFVLTNVVYAIGQKVYILDLKYDNGIITEENIKVVPGEAPDRRNQPTEGYKLDLISFNDETLYSFKFNFPLQISYFASPDWFDEQGDQIYFPTLEESGIVSLNETTLNLVISYFPDGKFINIYNPDGEKELEMNVGQFSAQDIEQSKISETTKTGQKIQTYFKEDKTGKIIKYIIYLILGIMLLVLIREMVIKIMDKYGLKKKQKRG